VDATRAESFEEHRAHLRSVAYRMLGSLSEAEDAVQEAWLRLSRADPAAIGNLRAWLTTVVSRICLDLLRSRAARREEPLDVHVPDPVVTRLDDDPAEHALLAESVGMALLVILDTLPPAERLAFVLHDIFAVPFEEIGRILGRTPDAAKQLASRARRRLRGTWPPAAPTAPAAPAGPAGRAVTAPAAVPGSGARPAGPDTPGSAAARGTPAPGAQAPAAGDATPGSSARPDATALAADRARQREIVTAFQAASRDGDFATLMALLDPDVVLRADAGTGPLGPSQLVQGAPAVVGQARRFAHLAGSARLVLINGAPGFLVAPQGRVAALLAVTVQGDRIREIDILADPARLSRLDLTAVLA
jgi:RNA polymerase sigma-70 factor (ECF subfamily)